MNDIECPECGSDHIGINAFTDLVPLDEQFMYTCRECNCQFNLPEQAETPKALEKIRSEVDEKGDK